ncbi:hypothetical protein [Aquisediminimonas sediminicola]|uniref:hypothetical protein n=1 Tax=Alteraquisediminimonas sediminicola TaxID=2676787 RepID=UPI001C8EFE31|nr:hypothetical protein [Aquisediminimonas sediminicola]
MADSSLTLSGNKLQSQATGVVSSNNLAVTATNVTLTGADVIAPAVIDDGEGTVSGAFATLNDQSVSGAVSATTAANADVSAYSVKAIGAVTNSALAVDSNSVIAKAQGAVTTNATTLSIAASLDAGDAVASGVTNGATIANVQSIADTADITATVTTSGPNTIANWADSLDNSSMSASSNILQAIADGTNATNTLAVTATSLSTPADAAGFAYVDTAADGGVTTDAAFSVANVQSTGTGAVSATLGDMATVKNFVDYATSDSSVTANSNQFSAFATSNKASNGLTLAATDLASDGGVVNVQSSSADVSATVGDLDNAGALTELAFDVYNSSVAVNSNVALGSSIGNSAANTLAASATNLSGTGDGGQGYAEGTNTPTAYASANYSVANQQSVDSDSSSTTSVNTTFGIDQSLDYDLSNSKLSVSNNTQFGEALGNSATNKLSLTATDVGAGIAPTAALSNTQYGDTVNVESSSYMTGYEDFRQSYVLNVKLVDCLLSDRLRYADQTSKLFEFLSSEFDSCEGFFEAYYAGGRDAPGLLSGLVGAWKKFVPTAIASSRNLSHVTQLLMSLSESLLETLANDVDELPEFVSANLPDILVRAPELVPERLERLGFEVQDLAAIREHPGIVRSMFSKGLFELTIANLEYAYHEIFGENDLEPLRAGNYTTLRETNHAVLIERIERDFDLYLHDVLLELQENSNEDAQAILAIIRRDNLDENDLREFLGRQATLLPSLENVPDKLHAMLFQLHSIEPTWANCLTFMGGEGFDKESLVAYLDQEDVRAAILTDPIPSDTNTQPLRQFLIEAATLCDAAYQEYAQALPMPFKKFPEGLERTKLRILIAEGKITFTKDSLDALADETDLQALFVAANIETYLADPGKFALDDDFREQLLRAEIGNEDKRALIELMDLNALNGLPERAALIGPILDRIDTNISRLDANIAHSLITHSRPIATQISLFNKCHSVLTDDDVRVVLANLPRPFSEITTGYQTPRLMNSPENIALVKWLDSRNIISSWSEGWLFTDDIRVNLKRR